MKPDRIYKRFLWLMLMILLMVGAGCSTAPVANLTEVRSIVEHAYASGAARYAPGEYQLASSALLAAEQQIRHGDSKRARNTLELARRYSSEALNITLKQKQQLALEQKRQAEEKRLEEQRREAALERMRQQKLALEAEQKRQQKLRDDAERKARKKKLAAEAAAREAARRKVETVEPANEIEVAAGENLADIAARKEVYADALLWPLIYRANRDQIKDPTVIFAGQLLVIPRDKTEDEQSAARLEAKDLNLF